MIKIKNLTYTYPARLIPTLKGLNLEIRKGEFVLIAGPTGCGKSTLLKAINGLIPHLLGGKMEGEVIVDGINTKSATIAELAQKVGLVFQNPDDQIFFTTVQDEVAFGPENLAFPKELIRKKVSESLELVGLKDFKDKSTYVLSGGQKQRLAIASVLSMSPKILLLDEPFAQLDPQGRKEILMTIKELNKKGITILLVEHRIQEVAHLVNRIIVMNKGKIILDNSSKEILKTDVFKKFKNKKFIKKQVNTRIVLQTDRLWFRYDKKTDFALKDVSLSIKKGEIISIMGNNGSGKSTLLLHFAALLKPTKGRCMIFEYDTRKIKPEKLIGKIGIVFQNPTLMLFNDTVLEEVAFGPKMLGLNKESLIEEVMKFMNIIDLKNENPLSLSGGQKLRVAVASVLSMEPEIILLDEPTSGQDKFSVESLLEYLYSLSKAKGKTVIFTTHEIDVALKYSDRILIMNKGKIRKIISDGSSEDIMLLEN